MRTVEKPAPPSFKTKLIAALIVGLMRLLYLTVRLKVERENETETLIGEKGGMLVTWHGNTFLPVARWAIRRRQKFFMLVSLSRDGDLQAEVFRQCGYGVVRGSTGRRGAGAIREVLVELANRNVLTFTPDGPRGPRGTAHPGVVYFAQRSGVPIIPAGISATPCWRLKSWDKYLIPYPFSRGHWIYGEPIYVSPEDDLETVAAYVSDVINGLEAQAEACLSASGSIHK